MNRGLERKIRQEQLGISFKLTAFDIREKKEKNCEDTCENEQIV